MNENVPEGLIQSIREGRCVAFVGAGFSQPLLPNWRQLLTLLARDVPDAALRQELLDWLRGEELSSRDFEGIAQTIHTALGAGFEASLRNVLDMRNPRPGMSTEEHRKNHALVHQRLRFLQSIPFHSILTTNFDSLLAGKPPSSETFAEVIGAGRRPWWSHRAWARSLWPRDTSWHAPVVKLHGDLNAENDESSLVFTTRGYRHLVHAKPGYRAFLRTLFATHSILYMGFSFSDAYINELRSEILTLIGRERGGHRLQDYAILADVPKRFAAHLLQHEGLECLTFSTHDKTDFSGFDRWLSAIYRETSPEATLRARVKDRKILWFDTQPKESQFGLEVLISMAGQGGAERVVTFENLEKALNAMAQTQPPYDLVISNFGEREGQPPGAQQLIEGMRQLPFKYQAPIIVFSQYAQRDKSRPLALRLGAFDYVDDWPSLFEAIERIFEPTSNSIERTPCWPEA